MFSIPFNTLTGQAIATLAAAQLGCNLQDWEKDIWQLIANWYNPAVTEFTVFTSGSTGAPKQITHTRQAMLYSAAATCHALMLKSGDNALLCLPANKIAGIMMIVRSLHTGMVLHCNKPSATPLQDIPDNTIINFAAFTPMQLHSAKNNYQHFRRAEQIDKIILGGENISAEMLQLVTRLQNEVYHTFGMTETVSHIALKKLNGKNRDIHYRVLEGIKISTGDGNRLIIEAPDLGQPHLVTNDIVKRISETEFDWLGRTDNVINSGGVKVYPEEIEQTLQAYIEPAFFIGAVKDERTGEKLVLAIEMAELSPKDKAELVDVLQQFDSIKRPKTLLLYQRFARTANGKIKRKETLAHPCKMINLFE